MQKHVISPWRCICSCDDPGRNRLNAHLWSERGRPVHQICPTARGTRALVKSSSRVFCVDVFCSVFVLLCNLGCSIPHNRSRDAL